MTPRSRKVAVFVGTAALAAGAGIGVASRGTSSAATEPRSASGRLRGGGGPGALPQQGGGPPGGGGQMAPPDGQTAPQPGTTSQS
jgi:hypothetical protein